VAPYPWALYLELLALWAALLPLGLLLLRGIERFRGRRFGISPAERVVLAPYLAGALFFLLASVVIPVFGPTLVLGLLAVGAAAMGTLWYRERGRSLRPAVRWVRSGAGALLGLTAFALLALEVASTGGRPYPNAYDGSFQSLYLQLLLSNHTTAWTLVPYANAGVIYPQSATVWLSLPILVWGWPIPSAPVVLPLGFFALAVPAAYAWGERLGGVATERGVAWGLTFGVSFAVLLSLPRLFIGGSYDFVFGLPLFLLALGWLRPFVERNADSWRDVIVFGGLLGVLTALSLSLGEALVLVLVGFAVVYRGVTRSSIGAASARLLAILGIASAFVVRSIVGVAIWYGYPEHVLSATGEPPYAVQPGLPLATWATFLSDVDPFVPFKEKLSPLPVLSVEIGVLLAVAVVVSLLAIGARGPNRAPIVPRELLGPLWIGTAVLFGWTSVLVVASGPHGLASAADALASLYETSYLLFLFYQVLALLPLLALVEVIRRSRVPDPAASPPERPSGPRPGAWRRNRRTRPARAAIGAVVLLAVPLAVGIGVSTVQAPTYLADHLASLSNVTASDVAALEWAGDHLGACSTVLVAPGSAGQFLPVFARVHLDFPMMPLSVNLSYNLSVAALTDGQFTPVTHAALLALNITEVFVSGRTSVSYLPFDPTPLLGSPEFTTLFHAQDAYLFEFGPGVNATGCPPG
jgi:hypothetical protein